MKVKIVIVNKKYLKATFDKGYFCFSSVDDVGGLGGLSSYNPISSVGSKFTIQVKLGFSYVAILNLIKI